MVLFLRGKFIIITSPEIEERRLQSVLLFSWRPVRQACSTLGWHVTGVMGQACKVVSADGIQENREQ